MDCNHSRVRCDALLESSDCIDLLPHPGNSAAQPFRRGDLWPSTASLRELGRLRHSVELVPTRPWDQGASAVPRVVERMAGSCQSIYVSFVDITARISLSAHRPLEVELPLRRELPKVGWIDLLLAVK